MTRPKVSIIINNYNYGRFLGEAIESSLAQTYPNVEVIVVDDGSTDNSREVIASFGNRVTPVLKANGGQGSALNAGFAISTGDLVLFLDSDDLLEPNAMEAVVREWRDGVSRAYFSLRVVDASGRPTGGVVGGTVSSGCIKLGPFCSGAAVTGAVLSRAALERALPMPEEDWRIAADYYLGATALLFGRAMRLEQVLGRYRVHGGNNGVCAGLLDKTRKRVDHDLSAYRALFRLTHGGISPLDDWLGSSPEHWVCRIKLLRESPKDYPWPDTLAGLTVRAVKAAWRRPGWKLPRRFGYSLYALAYGLLPRKLTRLLGKAVPMSRVVAVREHQEESDIMARAAERSREVVRA